MTALNDSPNTVPPTSSPPALSSPMVSAKKRVTQTYGSKRAEEPPSDESPDADRSFGTLVDGDISISLSPAPRSIGINDNGVSSQDTKVDDDDEEDGSPQREKHQWSWMAALEELNDHDDEAESASVPPISRRTADVNTLLSPPASRDRSSKHKGMLPSASPKKPQRLPLTTIRSESTRASTEPEASSSDRDHSPSPSPPKQKRRTSGRMTGLVMVEDSEPDASRASSSKSQGSELDSSGAGACDRPSPDPPKRRRKITTGRKPTAKVNHYDIHSICSH